MKEPISNYILHKLYEETGVQKTLAVLFNFPEKEFSLSDLAKESGVAKANIGKILHELEKAELVEKKELTKIWRIKAKQQSPIFRQMKIVHNLYLIYHDGLVEFLNSIYENPKSIILFGSFRLGEDISTSDIDIAIETENARKYGKMNLSQLKVFEKILGRRVQIHVFDRKTVDPNVFNNMANGIVLSGFLEVGL